MMLNLDCWIVEAFVCVSQARASDWKGKQCQTEWFDRLIEWMEVNEGHLGKGSSEE